MSFAIRKHKGLGNIAAFSDTEKAVFLIWSALQMHFRNCVETR